MCGKKQTLVDKFHGGGGSYSNVFSRHRLTLAEIYLGEGGDLVLHFKKWFNLI